MTMHITQEKPGGSLWCLRDGNDTVGWEIAESEHEAWRKFAENFWQALKSVKKSVNKIVDDAPYGEDGA